MPWFPLETTTEYPLWSKSSHVSRRQLRQRAKIGIVYGPILGRLIKPSEDRPTGRFKAFSNKCGSVRCLGACRRTRIFALGERF